MSNSYFDVKRTQSKGSCCVAKTSISIGTWLLQTRHFACVYKPNIDDKYILSSKEEELSKLFPSQVQPLACILSLRIAEILYKNETQRKAFMNLCHYNPNISDSNKLSMESTARLISQLTSNYISYEMILEILSRISLNAFTITDSELQPLGIGIFLDASFFNHSCQPNVTQSFSITDNGVSLYIHANEDIPVGTELCISYIDIGYPTWRRRATLCVDYGFYCQCARCTQFEPIIDAFRCPYHGCSGYLQAVPPRLTTCHAATIHVKLHTLSIPEGDLTELSRICSLCGKYSDVKQMRRNSEIICQRFDQAVTNKGLRVSHELFQKIYTSLSRLVSEDHYSTVHVLVEMCTNLIYVGDFKESLRVAKLYIGPLLCIYGAKSPKYCLQLLQFGKLLLHEGEERYGRRCVEEAIRMLTITHGSFHPIVKQAIALLSSY